MTQKVVRDSSSIPVQMALIIVDASGQVNVAVSLALLARPRMVTSILHPGTERHVKAAARMARARRTCKADMPRSRGERYGRLL